MRQHLIELILFSTYAELRAERSRSYLGLIWWVLDPALMMATFWLVFGVIMHSGGPDYVPQLLVGLTLWQWMKSCMTHGGYAIWSNLGLVRQVRGGEVYDSRFGVRMRGEGPFADLLAQRFSKAIKRLGLNQREGFNLDCTAFCPPGRQMALL